VLEFKPLNDVRCDLGECPTYDDRLDTLLVEDINNCIIHSFDLKSGAAQKWTFPSEVGAFGLTESGKLVVGLRHEVVLFDRDTGESKRIAEIETGRTDTRLNDGKVGPDGGFWIGSMDLSGRPDAEPVGKLYRVTADGRVEVKVEDIFTSNGLAWTPDGRTMFHSDSRGRWIDRWAFDPATGAISQRKRIRENIAEEDGRPDGAAADAEGCYWSAGVSAACLNRYDAEGNLVAKYPVPVASPTMPCFGGPDLKTLYVSSLQRSPEQVAKFPLTGIMIVGESPVAGAAVTRFKD